MSIIKYLLSALLLVSFAGQPEMLSANNPKHIEGVLSADNSGTFVPDSGGFTIGQLTVTDPLLIGIPNNQSAFALRIPISFTKKLHKAPAVVTTYFVDTASLIGQQLTGTATATVETVEVSVSGVTNFGFILNVGFFSFFDPGFTNATIPSLVSQLADRGFGINFVSQD